MRSHTEALQRPTAQQLSLQRRESAALDLRFVLLLNLYAVAFFNIAALMNTDAILLYNRLVPALLIALTAVVFARRRRPIGRLPKPLQAALALMIFSSIAAVLIGAVAGQSIRDLLIGGSRLAFIPIVILIAATERYDATAWARDVYRRHARAVSAVLLVALIATTASGHFGLLPFGNGVDALFVGVVLGGTVHPLRDDSWFLPDLLLIFMVTALSLKRGGWLLLALALVVTIAFRLVGGHSRRAPRSRSSRGVPARRLAGLAIVVALAVGAFGLIGSTAETATSVIGARARTLTDLRDDPSFRARLDETAVAEDALALSSLDAVLPAGAGYRFYKPYGPEEFSYTGGLHNTYLTGLALGGATWLLGLFVAIAWGAWRAAKTDYAFFLAIALVSLDALSGNVMLLPILPFAIGAMRFHQAGSSAFRTPLTPSGSLGRRS